MDQHEARGALDRTIEEALREQPRKAPPPGLYAKIVKRVRIEALIQQERRRVQRLALAGVGAIALTVGVSVGAWRFAGGWAANVLLPGALGRLDALAGGAVAFHMGTAGLVAAAAALTIAAGTLLAFSRAQS